MSRTLLHGMKMQWLILVHWNNWNILLGSFREETLKTIKNHALLVAKSRLQTATRLQVSGAAEANQTDERCVREPALGSNDFPVLLSSGTSEQWSMWETMAGLGSCDSFECSEDVLIRICSCFGVSNWLIDMSQEPWCKATVANLQWQSLWDFVVDCRIVEPELLCQVQTELLWERVWLGRIQSHSSLSCQELPYTNGWMTNWINWMLQKIEISFLDHKISFYHHERFDQVQIQMWHWYSRTKQESAVVHFHTDKVFSCSYEQFLTNRSSTKKRRHTRISWRKVYFRFSLWCGNPALRGKKDWPSGELHDEAIVLPESTD